MSKTARISLQLHVLGVTCAKSCVSAGGNKIKQSQCWVLVDFSLTCFMLKSICFPFSTSYVTFLDLGSGSSDNLDWKTQTNSPNWPRQFSRGVWVKMCCAGDDSSVITSTAPIFCHKQMMHIQEAWLIFKVAQHGEYICLHQVRG